ncbi:flagellar assembly protein FliH [Sutcliffiella horikoshii]|uniref:Flagellar assembly protein FliH n=1 Tax=Sutcliffiella horikoshii TaxID=79883 RepID=A0A5D4T4G6_9BACI|nr:flagellar assembly protein FliH [Sutcliffiella horikoshii]
MLVAEEMTSLSKLIKSFYLIEGNTESVSIKVAPIFNKKQSETKAETVLGHSIESINLAIEKAKREAAGILEQAALEREKAAMAIDEEMKAWESEKESWMQKAYDDGHEQGFQAGEKQAQALYEERLNEASRIIELAKLQYNEKLDSSIESIVMLSVKVAEKIIGSSLDSDPSTFSKLVQSALKEVKEKEEIKIYVSPSQYPNLLMNKQILQNIINSQFDLIIFPDADLQETGCWIDSTAGRIDVSIDTQLKEVKEHLLQLVRVEL